MQDLLSAAGRSFLRAFAGALIVLAPGVLAAPNLNRGVALGIAAAMASIAAGLKAIQVFIPRLSFIPWLGSPTGDWVDSFARAFLAAFITSIIGVLNMPDLSFTRSAAIGVIVGAVTAGLRAVQGVFTPGDKPEPGFGIPAVDPGRRVRTWD